MLPELFLSGYDLALLRDDPDRCEIVPGDPRLDDLVAACYASRTIAVVGASDKPSRASYFVSTYLLSSSPYRVYFVNPALREIMGRPVYPSLADLPETPDVVDAFRRHDDLPGVAREAVAVGARTLWLQLGSWHEEAARIAESRDRNFAWGADRTRTAALEVDALARDIAGRLEVAPETIRDAVEDALEGQKPRW